MKPFVKKIAATLMAVVLVFSAVVSAPAISGLQPFASIKRMGGSDRYQTADWIAEEGWDMSSSVILANGTVFPDALAGAPLAYALDAPILLVNGKQLNQTVRSRIQTLGATKVYILGGPSAVSEDIANELRSKNYTVDRISGKTRYDTAVEVAKRLRELKGTSQEIFIVSGENYPDALSVGPVAALKGAPVVYSTKEKGLPASTKEFITATGATTAHIIGGQSAVGDNIRSDLNALGIYDITRTYGSSRYETSLQVAIRFEDAFPQKNLAFATGKTFPDALAGGVFAAKHGAPLLLTDVNHTAYTYDPGAGVGMTAYAAPESTEHANSLVDYVAKINPENVYVFGGQNVLPDYVIQSYLPVDDTVTVSGTVYEVFEPVTSGNVADHGDALSGVTVTFAPEDESVQPFTATTDRSGKYSISGLKAGDYNITVEKSGYVTGYFTLEVEGSGKATQDLYLMAEPEEQKGTVDGYLNMIMNGKLVGVPNAMVTLASAGSPGTMLANDITDSSGHFSMEIEPGVYIVTAIIRGETASKVSKTIVVSDGKVTEVNLMLEVNTNGAIQGVVLHNGTTPIGGLPIRITNKETGASYSATSNSSGRFSFSSVPAGSYSMTVNVTVEDQGEIVQFVGSVDNVTVKAGGTLNLQLTVRVIRH